MSEPVLGIAVAFGRTVAAARGAGHRTTAGKPGRFASSNNIEHANAQAPDHHISAAILCAEPGRHRRNGGRGAAESMLFLLGLRVAPAVAGQAPPQSPLWPPSRRAGLATRAMGSRKPLAVTRQDAALALVAAKAVTLALLATGSGRRLDATDLWPVPQSAMPRASCGFQVVATMGRSRCGFVALQCGDGLGRVGGLSHAANARSACWDVCQGERIGDFVNVSNMLVHSRGGESGIRTHGTLARTHAFQACALSHSAISPARASAWIAASALPANPGAQPGNIAFSRGTSSCA